MARRSQETVDRAKQLAEQGMEVADIAAELDIPYATVYNWIKRQDRREARAAAGAITPPDVNDSPADDSGRVHDQPPRRPPDGREAPPPVPDTDVLDFAQLEQHISGIYTLVGGIVSAQDPILSEVITGHADDAAAAWAAWIRSEPRVAALLQRMMIGTPAGQLIYVHVSIGFGYFLARSAAADLNARLAADGAGTDNASAAQPA